jgi:hypothetical protein
MNYDFHQFTWSEPFTGFNAPLFPKRLEVWLLSRINTVWFMFTAVEKLLSAILGVFYIALGQ